MRLTAFGLCVRKLRLELGLTLRGMATALSISSPYLSSIELGEKPLTAKIAEQAVQFFHGKAGEERLEELRKACAESMNAVPVGSLRAEDRNLVAAFARRLGEGQAIPANVMKWLKNED